MNIDFFQTDDNNDIFRILQGKLWTTVLFNAGIWSVQSLEVWKWLPAV